MSVRGSRIIGGKGKDARRDNDLYPTPEGTTRAILPLLKWLFPKEIWECACGEGHMARELLKAGFDVTATDLIHRGYGEQHDFLESTRPLGRAIVSNPPFSLIDEFLFHAFVMLGVHDVAFVLPMQVFNARSRVSMFRQYPPAFVLPMTWRIDTTGEGRPTLSFMWCVWSSRIATKMRFMPLCSNEAKPGTFDALSFEELLS